VDFQITQVHTTRTYTQRLYGGVIKIETTLQPSLYTNNRRCIRFKQFCSYKMYWL